MKKFLLLFLTLACAAVAQVKIDIGDIDWPNQSASQLFRRNAANNGFEFFTASPQLTLTGDATGTTTFTNLGNGSLALTLANSGVTANTYGSATQVPSFTVDAKGRVTGVSLITATPAWGSVTGKPTTASGAGFTNGATIDSWGAKAVPTGTVVGTTDTQLITNKDLSDSTNTYRTATTSTRGGVQLATSAETLSGVDASKSVTPAGWNYAAAAVRNPLAPAGGVFFDGSLARIVGTLSGQSITTDPVSLVVKFRVPNSAPANDIGIIALSSATDVQNTSNRLEMRLTSAGTLVLRDSVTTACTVANFVSTYSGEVVTVAAVRPSTSSAAAIYVNGAQVSYTGTGILGESTTSTYVVIGNNSTTLGYAFTGVIYSATVYNFALTANEAARIWKIGGGVLEEHKTGTQTNIVSIGSALYPGASDSNNASLASVGNGGGGIGVAAVAGTRTGGSGSYVMRLTAQGANSLVYAGGDVAAGNLTRTGGQAFRYSVWARQNSGTPSLGLGRGSPGGGGNQISITSTWTQYSGVAYFLNSDNWAGGVGTLFISFGGTSGTGDQIDLDDLVIQPLGAVVHYTLDDGGGYQYRDATLNALHALRTTGGITDVIPRGGPFHARFSSSTNGNQQLGGQVTLPPNAKILSINARARTGTPTARLGSSSGGAEFVASFSFPGNTWRELTLVGGWIITTGNTSLWANSNSTDVIDWDVVWIPLSS